MEAKVDLILNEVRELRAMMVSLTSDVCAIRRFVKFDEEGNITKKLSNQRTVSESAVGVGNVALAGMTSTPARKSTTDELTQPTPADELTQPALLESKSSNLPSNIIAGEIKRPATRSVTRAAVNFATALTPAKVKNTQVAKVAVLDTKVGSPQVVDPVEEGWNLVSKRIRPATLTQRASGPIAAAEGSRAVRYRPVRGRIDERRNSDNDVAFFHVYPLHRETTAEELSSYLNKLIKSTYIVNKVNKKGDYSSFKVGMLRVCTEEVLKPEHWPRHTYIKEWANRVVAPRLPALK
jgi:hypothetical protein